MQGPGLPPLHNTGSLSASNVAGSSSGQTPESPSVSAPHMHPHLTSGKNLEIIWSKSHLVMRMIEMRIGQEPLLQVCALWHNLQVNNHHYLSLLRHGIHKAISEKCFHFNCKNACGVSSSEWQEYYYQITNGTFVLHIRYSTNCCPLLTVPHNPRLTTVSGQTFSFPPAG